MTSIFETVGYFGHRVQFSPFIDNMLYCVASSNTDCILNNSSCIKSSSDYSLDINATPRITSVTTATAAAAATTTTTSTLARRASCDQSTSTSSSSQQQQHQHHQQQLLQQQRQQQLTSTREAINSLPYMNDDHSSLSSLNLQPNLACASLNSSTTNSSTGFLYILDHFTEDISNPLKCFRSFYWPFGGLIDATWLNENYLWSVSTDGTIQIWNLSSYLPIEDALSDLEPSPDPVKTISAHSKVINSIDCNHITSDSSNLIVTSSTDSTIKLWDAKTSTLINEYNLNLPSTNVNCSISQFTPLHIPMVEPSLTSNVNFNISTNLHHSSTHLSSMHPHHHFTNGNTQIEQQTHHQSVNLSTNYGPGQSSSLLQLLEYSQYFHQMDESQTQSNLYSSSASIPSSSSSSSSPSSTIDSAIHSPSSTSSSSYPNTPPSTNTNENNCTGDHRSPVLLHSLLQSPTIEPIINTKKLPPLLCNGHSKSNDHTFVTWSPLISSTFSSCCSDGQIRIWSPKVSTSMNHRSNLTIKTDLKLTSCDWNKYNEYLLAVSSTNGTISIWDIRSINSGPVTVINGHKKSIQQVKFSPHSSHQLASVSCDSTTKIWTLDSSLNSICLNENDQMQNVKSSNYHFNRQQSLSGSLINTYRHHSDHVYGFDFNPLIKDRVVDCGCDSLVCLYSISSSTSSLNQLSPKTKSSMAPSLELNSRTPNNVTHSYSTLYSTAS